MDRLTPTDFMVIDALNRHASMRDAATVADVAAECSVAKSTVVKTAKKLGYSGFVEMREDLLNPHASGLSDDTAEVDLGLTTPDIVEGDALAAARDLGWELWCAHDFRNVSISGSTSLNKLLPAYLARSLAQLGVFAPATYDFSTISSAGDKAGVAIFFEHHAPAGSQANMPSLELEKPLAASVRRAGYRIVGIGDPRPTRLSEIADAYFPIKQSENPKIDLFFPRSIMLIELAISEFSDFMSGVSAPPRTMGEDDGV